jgi:D-3-phosphoglycerate dehydrogenase
MAIEESPEKHFVLDFDSTFTKVEALDILGEISLENYPDKKSRLDEIKRVTNQAMEGAISFDLSLTKRLALLEANKSHLNSLIEKLSKKVSKSVKRNKAFFEGNPDHTYILSNGFKEFIIPVVTAYGIKAENVFANDFLFDENDNIVGFNKENVLSANGGKALQIDKLKLKGDIHMIGDGYTDYEVRKAGAANRFYAYTENIERAPVTKNADHIAPSFDEILYHNNMNGALSYPKNRIKMLLLENVHPIALEKLKEEGFQVEAYPAGLDEAELCEKIKDVSVLGIRSKTQVTAKVLENADRLMAIGAFCIGTNQIDLNACLKHGVAVFNAPYSNTRSVVELTIAEIIFLMRGIIDKSAGMHKGVWGKTASGSNEIRGKKLGVIGYGNIGSQLSVLAEGLGMDVYYFDSEEKQGLGNATRCQTIEDLLNIADVVSLHIDGRHENNNYFGKTYFDIMKPGALFLNLSRGPVVDNSALKECIISGKIRGTGIDVFPYEPINNQETFKSELRGLPNTILTPHIGGSTQEAQANIADFVPNQIINYINRGNTASSVNFPNLTLPPLENAHRLIHIHENSLGIMAKINSVFAEHKINIVGQYLKTNDLIGYVITDINKKYSKELIKALKSIDQTIKFRVLY